MSSIAKRLFYIAFVLALMGLAVILLAIQHQSESTSEQVPQVRIMWSKVGLVILYMAVSFALTADRLSKRSKF
jgi:hypothetical protein